MTAPEVSLCLHLSPTDVALLLRQPELKAGRSRTIGTRTSSVWHDTPDHELATAGLGLALVHEGDARSWRLERMVADTLSPWPPGGPAPLVAEAAELDQLPAPITAHLAARLLPVVAFEGTRRSLTTPVPEVSATLLEGSLRAVTATRPVCRLLLSGTEAGVLAERLTQAVKLSVARDSLAAEAATLAGSAPPSRPLGAPALTARLDVDAGFALVVAHLAGVILHHAALAHHAAGPEPVHQMRVALRRLRSAILLFRRAVGGAALDRLTSGLKTLGQVLGPARDWDVFTQGAGRRIGRSFPDDAAVQSLLQAAERKRLGCYAALGEALERAEFRALGIQLASLALGHPWLAEPILDPEAAEKRAALQHADLADYAARALQRRFDKVVVPGPDLAELPAAELHQIRIQAKRLRYAAEFFSPLFTGRETRRFIRRLTAVQERLGQLNDVSVAADLMADLPQGGRGRAAAIGVVRGFVAGMSSGGRSKMEQSWRRFLKLEPFWH